MNKTINIDGVEYNLVPVLPTQEATKETTQTKYRKNGALVFAPENKGQYWKIADHFDLWDNTWFGYKFELIALQQGLVFDNKEACQLWADKMKVAYALKQRIVKSESEDEYLEKCVIWFGYKKEYAYEWRVQDIDMLLIVSTNAKDILMSGDVSDEDFKAFIGVFSL